MAKVGNTSEVSAKVAANSPPRAPRSKQSRIDSELKKLRELTKDAIPDEKRKAIMPLLPNLAFMKVKLDDARADLLYEDIFTEYDNGGGQSGLREHPRKAIMPLLPNLAFMKVKLDDARADLLYEDIFTEYDNGGGQSGLREHPGFSAYNKLFTTFSRSVKQLADMMPNGTAAADALIDFINETRC